MPSRGGRTPPVTPVHALMPRQVERRQAFLRPDGSPERTGMPLSGCARPVNLSRCFAVSDGGISAAMVIALVFYDGGHHDITAMSRVTRGWSRLGRFMSQT
jgi:hypothetical protein